MLRETGRALEVAKTADRSGRLSKFRGRRLPGGGGRRQVRPRTGNPAEEARPELSKCRLRFRLCSAGETDADFLLSFRLTELNSLGAEWETFASVGDLTRVFSEWYQPVDALRRFFFAVDGFYSNAFFNSLDARTSVSFSVANWRRRSGRRSAPLGVWPTAGGIRPGCKPDRARPGVATERNWLVRSWRVARGCHGGYAGSGELSDHRIFGTLSAEIASDMTRSKRQLYPAGRRAL